MEQISEWQGQEVLDAEGEKVGKLDEVYYGTRSGDALLAVVKRGVLGRRSTIVPLKDATVGRDYVRVNYNAEQLERAGELKSADELDERAASEIFAAYGLEFQTEELESSELISRRLEAAEEAARRAAELDEEVDSKTRGARDLRERAKQADAEADAAEDDLQRVRGEAQEAHRVADEGSVEPPAGQAGADRFSEESSGAEAAGSVIDSPPREPSA